MSCPVDVRAVIGCCRSFACANISSVFISSDVDEVAGRRLNLSSLECNFRCTMPTECGGTDIVLLQYPRISPRCLDELKGDGDISSSPSFSASSVDIVANGGLSEKDGFDLGFNNGICVVPI